MGDIHDHHVAECRKLARTRAGMVWPLSVVLVAGLAGNLYLMSSGADLGARTVFEGGVVTIAIAYSLVLIALGAGIAGFYAWWAHRRIDPLMKELHAESTALQGGGHEAE